ncbi:MAG: HAD family hydrolase [Chitinophagales bacterium]
MQAESVKIVSSWGIDKNWTLFLDRDGVINQRIIDNYVCKWEEFHFIEGVLEAIKKFSFIFDKIVVVTNQRGINRGLMTHQDLQHIFDQIRQAVIKSSGRIDQFYYCPHLAEENCNCRKPKVGMGLQAKADFPSIQFEQSIMVGDMLSDMEFGKSLSMKTIYLTNHRANYYPNRSDIIDAYFSQLSHFANVLMI